MTTANLVSCPHCGSQNPATSAFCQSCGKAIPTAGTSPRIVANSQLASTGVGQTLQSEELQQKSKTAFGALLAVGILQIIFGFIIVQVLGNQLPPTERTLVMVMVFGVGAVFLGLAFWARFQPLPAAIVGLVLYLSIWVLDIIGDPSAAYRGILIKLIIVAVLVKAIQAGVAHRKLRQQAGMV